MTTIKLPACYDVSFWQQKIDWSVVSPKPALVICKASEGVGIKDPTFLPNFTGLTSQNIRRGCYHFHRKIYTGLQNATYFLGVVRGILTKQDLIVLDVEEGGESAAQLLAWLDAVSAVYPENLILIYSRKTVLDTIATTPTQAARLRQYPTWMAGYPLQPDNYNDIPAGYVPDPTKWGAVYLWQYSDKGIVQGISGNTVDLNWISPTLKTILGTNVPPTGETGMYNLQVNSQAVAYLNGRDAPAGNINFPAGSTLATGFRGGDILVSDLKQLDANGITTWYRITQCQRAGVNVTLPATVWASDGGSAKYLIAYTATPDKIEIMLTAGSTITIKDTLGNVLWTGQA